MILKPKFFITAIFLCTLQVSINAQSSPQFLLAEGQYDAIIKQLEPKSQSLSFPESYYLALAYQQLGFPDKAIQCLTNTSAMLNSQQLDLLCRCYLNTGNYTKALPIIKNTYQQAPANTVNLLRYAEVNHFYKEYKANVELLKKYTQQDSSNYNINLFLAESYEKTKQTSHAIATYQMILQAHPNNQKVALKLANLYYSDKQYVECHDLCVPYIERLENNKNFLLLAGMANFKNGSNHNVMVLFKRLEAQGDSSFLTKKHLGIASYRLENFDNATNYLKSAIKLKDDDPEVAFFLGASLGQSNQPLDGKIFLLIAQELIKPSPVLMEKTNLKLAMMHFDTGHYQMAINYYNKAYIYAPSNHQYLYRQASIYDYQLKDAAKAKELYQQFIDALPEDLNPKKGNELYAIKLKKVASNRLNNLIEEDFFKNGIN
ncbi:tetratricopeptide repeat protein [Carboxylicivirga mesophila]|uniref:Tetratricopeptide repeat protein n=1 Tax=Carboxylicivirga mesophila TaxID=1166478 RepID=A0ABS5K4V5_9BACT|nr:tetratricopeptide repeat protein [Carboxylicivirga mesophila]MBS2210037.1 tetratricopeptide repeat protein [Carboxylicivirga mesophila]